MFVKNCEILYVLVSKNSLKILKDFHTLFLLVLWYFCDDFCILKLRDNNVLIFLPFWDVFELKICENCLILVPIFF
jgi:hypothetical protein